MNAMLSVRAAFDPLGLCNPGKIVPLLRGCGEAKAISGLTPSVPETPAARLPAPAPSTARATTKFDPDRAVPLLAQILGDENITARDSTITVFPSSADQISETLKLASRDGWTVLPAGGMTWLKLKANVDLTVNTSRLNQIIEHEPADLIAVAQAGVKLIDFNAKLAENGQWLPLDPPDDGRASIGGVVATGTGGAQQFGYGRPRGSVIGMKVVLADGSVIKAGGRVVKNVAGYDLCKLFAGSFGSLGIITEVNFKLRPRPAREATVIAMGSIPELLSSARAILERRLFPVAAEVVSPAFANRLSITTRASALLVRFAGNEKGVAYQLEQALAQMKGAEVVLEDGELWRAVAAAPLSREYAVALRASVLPSELLKFIDRVAEVYDEAFAEKIWQAGALDGRMIVLDDNDRHAALFERRNSVAVTSLMQRVKQQLDPLNILPLG
jgi:FAD/FMN-containing dehydrogenase